MQLAAQSHQHAIAAQAPGRAAAPPVLARPPPAMGQCRRRPTLRPTAAASTGNEHGVGETVRQPSVLAPAVPAVPPLPSLTSRSAAAAANLGDAATPAAQQQQPQEEHTGRHQNTAAPPAQQEQEQQRSTVSEGALAALRLPPQPLHAHDAGADEALHPAHPGTLWGLAIMTLGYLHLSVTLYTLPSLLPFITQELALDDTQGAWLTTGYTILYGLALVPVGALADKVNRPRLLAGGIALWSVLTMAASQSHSFGQLMASRVGFALAQATCNPVAYSLIPELFPNNRTAAMAVYNCAIYLGRAAAFGVVFLAGQQGLAMAGVDVAAALGDAASTWRPLLWWLAPPGLALAALAVATVEEPRQRGSSGAFLPLVTLSASSMDEDDTFGLHGGVTAAPAAAAAAAGASGPAAGLKLPQRMLVSAPEQEAPARGLGDSVRLLLSSRSFVALTAATSFGDIASWALIGWQATYYQRVYELDASVYGPLLAIGISVGGIIGGVGSGLFGDRLSRVGKRGLLTAGTSVVATPLMAASFMLPDYQQSFYALLIGYALSECWRAPAAVMVREVSPPGLGSTAGALNLCFRMLLGSLGPLGIAALANEYGLERAILLIPACHLLCGIGMAATESVIKEDRAAAKAARHALAEH